MTGPRRWRPLLPGLAARTAARTWPAHALEWIPGYLTDDGAGFWSLRPAAGLRAGVPAGDCHVIDAPRDAAPAALAALAGRVLGGPVTLAAARTHRLALRPLRASREPAFRATPAAEAAGGPEPETDPARIDWPARQARAAIPFRVARDGRPVNPCQGLLPPGRGGLWLWGENLMADALVTAVVAGRRHLLMVLRADDGVSWAAPGGSAEPGETGLVAAVRELAEETGLAVPLAACRPGDPLYVADPRAGREAWAVTVPVRVDLGVLPGLPAVSGAGDAARAEWIPARSWPGLVTALERGHRGGRAWPAHVSMLSGLLGPAPARDSAGITAAAGRRDGGAS